MRDTPTESNRPFLTGFFLALGGTALFALKSIFVKLAYAQGVDTETLLMLRMSLAAPFYVFTLLWLWPKPEQTHPNQKQLIHILILGFFGYYLSSWLDLEGLTYVSAQLERMMLYTYPLMTTILGALLLKERITWRVVVALLLTYAGVMVLYLHEAKFTGTNITLGLVLVASSALVFAFYVVISKGLINQLGSRLFTAIAMLSSTFFVAVHFFIKHSWEVLQVKPIIWFYGIMLAIFSTVLPSFMMGEAINRIGAGRTSIVGTFGPIVTILLAVVLLDEPFGVFHLMGIGLVMVGVSFLSKK